MPGIIIAYFCSTLAYNTIISLLDVFVNVEVIIMKNFFGTNLNYLRKINNMTQTTLANKLGITHQTISNYENGNRYCDLDMLIQISELFNVSIDDLLKKKLY